MKNKAICGIVYIGSFLASVILFFVERRYRIKKRNEKSL
ncbi:hypothetical protein SAMN05421503_2647 [Terribacillus aidingensis]|uniref:Uncharacterized protein n=1 Tax=Terribacillus aidingensis TaxID=586416 RepID=A0A285P5Q7_9BACI|nr:hypothetical protein SAMN05421503_2647 [Terribacillus aidingensis]